jgi:hypothetical protein
MSRFRDEILSRINKCINGFNSMPVYIAVATGNTDGTAGRDNS